MRWGWRLLQATHDSIVKPQDSFGHLQKEKAAESPHIWKIRSNQWWIQVRAICYTLKTLPFCSTFQCDVCDTDSTRYHYFTHVEWSFCCRLDSVRKLRQRPYFVIYRDSCGNTVTFQSKPFKFPKNSLRFRVHLKSILLPVPLLTAQNWNPHYKLRNKDSDKNFNVTRWERALRTESGWMPVCAISEGILLHRLSMYRKL